MQDPAEGTAEGNELYGSNLELHPTPNTGVQLNDQEAIDEADGAEGNTCGHLVKMEDKFTSSIIQKIPPSKSCHCLRDTFREKNHTVG